MNNQTLVNILIGIKQDLRNAYITYSSNTKDTHIKAASGKLDVLLEIAKEGKASESRTK